MNWYRYCVAHFSSPLVSSSILFAASAMHAFATPSSLWISRDRIRNAAISVLSSLFGVFNFRSFCLLFDSQSFFVLLDFVLQVDFDFSQLVPVPDVVSR